MKTGWQRRRLGDIAEVQSGGTPLVSNKANWGGDIPWYSSGELNCDFTSDSERHISSHGLASSNAKLFPTGSLLIGMYDTAALKMSILDLDAAFNQAIAGVKPTANLDLLFVLRAITNVKPLLLSQRRGVRQKNLSLAKIKDIEIALPPLPEQRRIVGILDEAFAAIATAKANVEKNLQNARDLFESHLNAIDDEQAPLGDLVNIKTGKLDANAAVEGGEYPFFTCSREIYAIDNYAFDCEAILLAGNNAVGDFNVKHYKGKFNAYQRTYVITVNEKNRVLYRFLYFQMLKSLAKFKSQSVGAGTKFLKLGMIKDMEIALPALAEQEQIVVRMDSIREETQRLESIYQRKLAALDELKKSLLHQAFSGKL